MEFGEKNAIHIPTRPAVSGPEAPVPSNPATGPVAPGAPALENAPSTPRFIPAAVQALTPLPSAPDPLRALRKPEALEPVADKPLASSKMVLLASAALGLIVLGTYLTHRSAKAEAPVNVPEAVDHLDLSEFSALPEALRPGAQALMAGAFQLPAWFHSLESGSGGELEYPVQEAIEEVQPTLHWPPSASFYHVAVISPNHEVVARAEIYNDTHWTVPAELTRGSIYLWEVATTGQVRRSSFRVLDETEAGWLTGLRVGHGQSHLVMGVASLELGLLTPAQREFHALVQEHPHSPEAAQLLRTVDALLVRARAIKP